MGWGGEALSPPSQPSPTREREKKSDSINGLAYEKAQARSARRPRFLGDPPLIQEITAASGVRKWQPDNVADDDYQRKLW